MGWYTPTTLLPGALVTIMVVTIVTFRRFIQHRIERRGYPLPPGPIPLPLLGSVLSVDAQAPHFTYTEWREEYGDIIYVRLLDTDIIVLNLPSIATELIEGRSRKYSDRPFFITLEPYGNDCNFGFIPYGEQWRLRRKIFHQTFHANSALSFRPMQLQRARELVSNIIDDPKEYQTHFHAFAAAVSMSAVYDYDPIPRNDPMVSIISNYLEMSVPGLAPSKILLVKLFPFLLHIPEWLPGSWVRREVKEARKWKTKMVETPYQCVKNRMESGEHVNMAMVSDHIIRMENFGCSYRSEYEAALKDASATAFLASVETSTAALLTFVLAMVQNPHIWKRAQVEIDTVIETGGLPEFKHRASLPYIDAIARETLRWRPVVPMLIPHATTCSDIYKGYYIPKGATALVNAWAMSRDKIRYPDAETFVPERFLDEDGRLTDDNPSEFVFGFGRRKCPGRYAADASLWSAIATMLATLNFNLAKDADGNDITFQATFTNGLTDHPIPFPCRLTPRTHVSKEALCAIFAEQNK